MKRGFLATLGSLFLASAASAALSPENFTREFVTQMRAALPGGTVEIVAPMQVQVTDGKGHEQTIYLDNAFGLASNDPDSRQAIIEQFVRSMVEQFQEHPALDPSNIVAIVKNRAWTRDMAAALSARGAHPPAQWSERLNDELDVLYAEDTPTNIRYLSRDDIEKAGVKIAALRALAVSNLRRKLPGIELHEGELYSMLTAGGNYEASLLLFDDIWAGKLKKVDGEIVVAIPSRDVLIFTGSHNVKGVAKLRELARQIQSEGNYTLTNALFVYRGGRFLRFEP